MKTLACLILATAIGLVCVAQALSQQTAVPDPSHPVATGQTPASTPADNEPPEPPGGKRVFGVLPNYRTADASQIGTVLTARQKLTIASKDSFDYPLVVLAGVYAGLGQLTNADPSFGQGPKGYAHRLVTNYGDQAMGNMFAEGLFPVILREDPRYFQIAAGSTWHRAQYAISRSFVTHKDSGGRDFNYSEWFGNATAVAISNAYYPDNRTLRGNGTKLLEQVGTDTVSQVLKEFWPDIKRSLFHR
jgi:hypothetical protein